MLRYAGDGEQTFFKYANLTKLSGGVSDETFFMRAIDGELTKERASECLAFVRDLTAVVCAYIVAYRAYRSWEKE